MRLTLHADGASRGNPGPAGAGAVITYPDGTKSVRTRYLGSTTNNVAEWSALILALQVALEAKADEVDIYMDSELVVKQARGEHRVGGGLQPYYQHAQSLLMKFKSHYIEQVSRDQNQEAELASNKAIDERRRSKPAEPVIPPVQRPKVEVQLAMPLFPDEVDGPIFPPNSEAVRKFVQQVERKLKFTDYAKLHSGRDEFSVLRLQDLAARLPSGAVEQLEKEFSREDDRAKAARWVLRGLPVAQAVRKVRTDLELGMTANQKREWQDTGVGW